MRNLMFILFAIALVACGGEANSQEDGYTDIDKSKIEKLVADGAILLDVRTPEEVAEGMIEGAQHMDFYDDNFATQLESIKKDVPIIVYCKSGGRSSKTASMMSEMGWTTIYNLTGGYSEYSEE